MKKITKIRRSVKAISPVISVLLMIAIAVAASLVAYAWVMGYMDFTVDKVGKQIQIQSISSTAVYVQNIGESPVTLKEMYVDDELVEAIFTPSGLPVGNTSTITTPLPLWDNASRVTIKVVTSDGVQAKLTETFSGNTGGTTIPVVTPPPTVTRVATSTSGFSGVQAGDLLVVIANTRTGTNWNTGTLTASASGYTNGGAIAAYRDDDSDRRAVVVLTKIATGSETGSVSVSWTGTGTNTYATFYQIFRGATTYAVGDSDVVHNGGNPAAETTALPALGVSGSSTANVLTIGAGVWRDSPGTVTMTNLEGQYGDNFNGCYSESEFSYGDAVTGTTITWTTQQLASGLLVQFNCS